MTKYLVSVHNTAGQTRAPMSDAEMQQSYQQMNALEEEMKSAGAFVFSGRLYEPDTATVVRVSNGEAVTTDGPFAESKEYLAGFYIIEADNLDGAMYWASRTTALVGAPIEVRPFWDEPAA
ncbi:YciI family protein [Arthrobacter sp. AL08]|uniref:YciI family protein n=1 Tax=unclassified Arthrobacter TaxID=235627 RepID=UPI00249AD623|nr:MULTISPECIES: YciI family protein [unclassified Arthrobacter]MDI3243354.1 YciI family protein [Arthrobacter sp. AL05]MDI3279363.1 YciI family protein [Arthrobacter sp. AL08]